MRVPTIQNPLAWLLVFSLLSATVPAFAEQPSPKQASRQDLTIDPVTVMQPWKGDLDRMDDLKKKLEAVPSAVRTALF